MASSKQFLAAAALCALTNAFPQGLDFAAISAAPSIAQGPAAIETGLNPAVQTASLYTNFAVSTVAAAQSTPGVQARGLSWPSGTIFGQIINSMNAIGLGAANSDTTVKGGASVTLNGNGKHDFIGNLANQGSVAISGGVSSGLSSSWSGSGSANGNLVNYAGALLSLSDIDAHAAADFNWNLNSFLNNGTIQFCARGDFDAGASQYLLGCGHDQTNNGLISFEQLFGSLGASFSWKTSLSLSWSSLFDWSSPKLYNNGAFHLVNTIFHGFQNVFGSGCWQIGLNASLILDGSAGAIAGLPFGGGSAVWADQSIFFLDSSALLHLDAGVYSSSSFGASLYGFGQDNTLRFSKSISAVSYNSASGVLNVKFAGNWFFQSSVAINIGKGYDAGKFRVGVSGSYSAVFYDGVAPAHSAPAQCRISTSPCSSKPNPPSSSSVITTSVPVTSTSSAQLTTTTVVITSACTPVIPTITSSSYSPYYPALTTGYTTNPAASTTTSGQTCPTHVEDGTYCGFINPNDPCAPQPDGYGPVPTPDTASAFLAYPPFHSMANTAPTEIASPRCGAYEQVFRNLNASVSANSYLALYVLQSYDVQQCANFCNANKLCTSFNIFIERDPTVNPSTAENHDPTVWGNVCPNPGSMTSFKCTLWGSSIDATIATNQGGYRVDFEVVIAGSDGYDRTNNSTPLNPTSPGDSSSTPISTTAAVTSTTSSGPVSTSASGNSCKPPQPCYGYAIDAIDFWISTRFFPGPFNPQVCSDFALAQNALNAQQNGGTQCKMFNAYYVNRDGHPHGTTCALYDTVLNSTWATYSGGISGRFSYTCEQSWTYELVL